MSGGHRRHELGALTECAKELDGKLVITEGPRDSKALKSLGVKNIISLNGRPLSEFAIHVSRSIHDLQARSSREAACKEEVVILTDFDSEGERIASKLSYLLSKHKVMVNERLRRKFMKFGKSRIEELKEGDYHVEIGSDFDKVCDKGPSGGKRGC